MTRRAANRSLVVAAAVSFLSQGVADQPAFTLRSEVRLVVLDVAVKDHQGGFVTGLTKDSFSVTENGRPQTIAVFANGDVPVTVGILVDESRSMTPKRDDVLAAAQTFLEESNPQDEIFVLNFNDNVRRGLPEGILFSDNVNQLRSALYRGTPQGKTALNDAVVEGLQQLQLGKRDKKALIVISDGGDNASQAKRGDMLALVERSLATVYTVGLYDADDQDRNPGILKDMAKISGGVAYFPEEPSKMTAVCHSIAREIRTRYTIGYTPPPGGATGSLRHIHVAVSAPGRPALEAHTRSRYRYDELENRNQRK